MNRNGNELIDGHQAVFGNNENMEAEDESVFLWQVDERGFLQNKVQRLVDKKVEVTSRRDIVDMLDDGDQSVII